MDLWPLYLSICLGVLAAKFFRPKRDFSSDKIKPFSSIPTAPGRLPLIGNLLTVLATFKRPQLHLPMLEWSRLLGPVYRMMIPGFPEVVIVLDSSLLPGIIGRPGLRKMHVYSLVNAVSSPAGRPNLLTRSSLTDPKHRAVRKGVLPCFSSEAMRAKFPVVRDKATLLADGLQRRGPSAEIDVEEAMERATADIILAAGNFGLDLHALHFGHVPELDALVYCIGDSFRCMVNPLRRPACKLLPFLPLARTFARQHSSLYAFWERLWDAVDARCTAGAAGHADIATALWRLQDASSHPEGAPLTTAEAREEMANMLVEAIDTTATELSFSLLNLAAHPQAQAQVAEELREAGLLCEPSAPARQLQHSDLSKLPFLDAVVKESMRLWPVLATGTSRITDVPMQLGDFYIPAGVSFAVPHFALHRSARYFPRPDEFLPQRWLPTSHPSSDAALRFDASRPEAKYEFQPFSVGSRSCPGQPLALLEILTIMVTVLGRFEVRTAERMSSWPCIMGQTINRFTPSVEGGTWLRFCPRAKLE